MLNLKGLQDEKTLMLGLFLLLGFTYLTVSHDMANLLGIMVSAYGFVVLAKKKPLQFIKRIDSKSIAWIIGGVIAWGLISGIIANQFGNTKAVTDLPSLAHRIYLDTNVPVLDNNKYVIMAVYGFAFPIFETLGLLALAMTFWAGVLKTSVLEDFNFKNFKHIWLVLLVGATCSLYHLVVRQGQDLALFSDFVFFGLSVIVAMKRKQLFEAFGIHAIVNTIVVLLGGG